MCAGVSGKPVQCASVLLVYMAAAKISGMLTVTGCVYLIRATGDNSRVPKSINGKLHRASLSRFFFLIIKYIT